jgi:hypothetical protein
MDGMLQAQLLQYDTRCPFDLVSLQKLTIDVKSHAACIHALRDVNEEVGEFQICTSLGLWASVL